MATGVASDLFHNELLSHDTYKLKTNIHTHNILVMTPAKSLEMTVGTSSLTCDRRRNYESYYSEGLCCLIFMRFTHQL